MSEATKENRKKSLGERMDELFSALKTLQKRQDDWEEAQASGTPAEQAEAAENLETAEEKLDTKAKAAGMSDEDVARIADRVISTLDDRDAAKAAAAAAPPAEEGAAPPEGEAATALENLAEGVAPPPEESTAPPPGGEEAPSDAPPEPKHWSQRRIGGGGD
jgi:hypothetical protein